jgi:mono/diheme cytochrome c family protein
MTENRIEQSPAGEGHNWAPLFVLMGIFVVALVVVMAGRSAPFQRPAADQPPTPTAVAMAPTLGPDPPPLAVVAAQYHADQVAAGERVYATFCFACHGQEGIGISGLGKPLVESEFIDSQTDEELLTFLIVGRSVSDPLNTTGQVMPARGGNPMLSDEDLMNVVAYIRSLNGAAVEGEAEQVAAGSSAVAAVRPFEPLPLGALDPAMVPAAIANTGSLALPAMELVGQMPDVALDGSQAFAWACSTCHTSAADLGETAMTDDEIITMLTSPNPAEPGEAFVHPYRGGFPTLTDAALADLVAFLRGAQ